MMMSKLVTKPSNMDTKKANVTIIVLILGSSKETMSKFEYAHILMTGYIAK